MNKPDRSEKLNRKLRASETARIAAVRKCEALEKGAATAVFTIRDLKKKLNKAWEENNRLQDDRDALKLWTEEHCTCGGDGPDGGCLACSAYHAAGLGGKR